MALRLPSARAAPAVRPAPAAIRRPSRSPLSVAAASVPAAPGAAAAASAGRRRSAGAFDGPAAGLRPHTPSWTRRGAIAVPRAEPPNKPEPPSGSDGNKEKKDGPLGAQDERVEAVLEEMKRSGMNASKAKQLLSNWTKMGVDDPDQLRKMLVQRSVTPLAGAMLQAGIDTIVAYGGFSLANTVAETPDMGFLPKISLELIGNFAGIYYGVNAVLELGLAAAILFSTYKYGASAPEVLAAVRELAKPRSGLKVVDTVEEVVNTLKVLRSLEDMATVLRAQFGDLGTQRGGRAADSLANLSALLTLRKAKEEGFEPEAFGLSEATASNIALAFNKYDVNDNGVIDPSELGDLCDQLGQKLSDPELQEAFRQLDTDKSGYISYKEFACWWSGRCPAEQKVQQGAA